MAWEMSEKEIARLKRKIPGFSEDADDMGHQFDAPEGRVWMRGVKLKDEIFESASFGTLNISEILRNVADDPRPLQPLDIDANLLRNVSQVDINIGYAKRLTREQLRRPILMIAASDGFNVVRRQGFWDNRRRELTEALVHQVCHIRPLHLDEASGAV